MGQFAGEINNFRINNRSKSITVLTAVVFSARNVLIKKFLDHRKCQALLSYPQQEMGLLLDCRKC